MKTLHLEVTQADIYAGHANSWCGCPIAHVAADLFGCDVGIGLDGVVTEVDVTVEEYPMLGSLSASLAEFIDRFDQGYFVYPTTGFIRLTERGETLLSSKEEVLEYS